MFPNPSRLLWVALTVGSLLHSSAAAETEPQSITTLSPALSRGSREPRALPPPDNPLRSLFSHSTARTTNASSSARRTGTTLTKSLRSSSDLSVTPDSESTSDAAGEAGDPNTKSTPNASSASETPISVAGSTGVSGASSAAGIHNEQSASSAGIASNQDARQTTAESTPLHTTSGAGGLRGQSPSNDPLHSGPTASGPPGLSTTTDSLGSRITKSALGTDQAAVSTGVGGELVSNSRLASESMAGDQATGTITGQSSSPASTTVAPAVVSWGSEVASASSAIAVFKDDPDDDNAGAAIAAIAALGTIPAGKKAKDISGGLGKMSDTIKKAKDTGPAALPAAAEEVGESLPGIGTSLTNIVGPPGGPPPGGSSGGSSGGDSNGEDGNEKDKDDKDDKDDDDKTTTDSDSSTSTTSTESSTTSTSATSATSATSSTTSTSSKSSSSTITTTASTSFNSTVKSCTAPRRPRTATALALTTDTNTETSSKSTPTQNSTARSTTRRSSTPATGANCGARHTGTSGSGGGSGRNGSGGSGSGGKGSGGKGSGGIGSGGIGFGGNGSSGTGSSTWRAGSSSSARITSTPTRLTHHADQRNGDDYCEGKDGKRYSTAKRPSSTEAYQPCDIYPPATPIPFDTPSRTTTMSTDFAGTVWFCPSATPNDLRVHNEYDCGPSSVSRTVISSISASHSVAVSVSAASASASAAVGLAAYNFWFESGVMRDAKHSLLGGAKLYWRWKLFVEKPDTQVPCNKEPHQYWDRGDGEKHKAPWPPSRDDIKDAKVGDNEFKCKYEEGDDEPGTLKCDGYEDVKCAKHQEFDEEVKCDVDHNWAIGKVECVIRAGDKI